MLCLDGQKTSNRKKKRAVIDSDDDDDDDDTSDEDEVEDKQEEAVATEPLPKSAKSQKVKIPNLNNNSYNNKFLYSAFHNDRLNAL